MEINNVIQQNGISVINGQVVLADGTILPPCPSFGHTQVIVNNKVYIDGYEYRHGEWRRTLRAIWHTLF